MRVRAVAFDIGGVMVRISQTWSEAAASAGVEVVGGDAPFSEFDGFEAYQAGRIGDEEYLWGLARYLKTDLQGAALVHRHILAEATPGSEGLVEELEAIGIVSGCLSNTNALHWTTLVEDGTYPALARLTVKVGSHVAHAVKPQPDIYQLFERNAGASGHEVAYFDDVAEYVEGGRSLGWQARHIVPGLDPVSQMRAALVEMGLPLRAP